MEHPVVEQRHFRMTYEEMLQQSELRLSLFIENKSRFKDRFPDLADPFADEWSAAIAASRTILPDYASVSQQSKQTDALEILMNRGRAVFQTTMLYAQFAYPNDPTVLRLLGKPKYDAARASHLKLPALLRTAYATASASPYREALMAKGMQEADIQSLLSLADSIPQQDLAQESAKNDRSTDSAERIHAMNAVWDKMALVSKCAKLVFAGDATLYDLFLLPEGSSANPDEGPAPPSASPAGTPS